MALRHESPGGDVREANFPWPATDVPAGDAARDLDLLARQVRDVCPGGPGALTGVGIAVPATLDPAGTVTAWPNRPGWIGTDLRAALGGIFGGVPVDCADDGDLAALAEARAAGCADLLYLGVGTGIGGGIVLDGRLLPGTRHGSCEVGHLVVDRGGARCGCGRRGCVQAVASGPATLRRAALARNAAVTAPELGRAVRDGVPWAVDAVRESAAALAAAAIGVGELLRPSLVLVGGGFAAGVPELTAMVAEETARLARPGHPAPPVRPALLGGVSSLYGAVELARGLTA